MIRSILSAGVLGITAVGLLVAAPFWLEKPFSEWNQKEVSKVLTDSPWARSAEISFDFSTMRGGPGGGGPGGGGPGAGGPGGGMGGPSGGMGGPGGGMGGPGGGMGGPAGGGMPQFSAIVMWRSALVVRQAMYQAAVLQESPAAESLERALNEEPTHHILAVSGLPAMGGPGMGRSGTGGPGTQGGGNQMPPREGLPQMSEEQRQKMREQMEARQLANTKLTIGKEVLSAERMQIVQSGENRILLFYFEKSQNLSASDKEAKFETQLGPLKVAATFKPKEMVFAVKPRT